MPSSNGNMFRVTGFLWGIHRWLRGIHQSSVNSPHTDQWRGDLMFSLNKRLSKQSRRRWFETPSRSLWRHCNVVPNSDPVVRAAVRFFGVQRVTPVQFWIGEWNGSNLGGQELWKNYGKIMEGMASNLTHCSTLMTIPWNQLYILHSAAV